MQQAAETVKRIRAARGYAGLSQAELADEIGVGADVIKRIESIKREAKQMELDAIAKVCGLPTEWFTADYSKLSEVKFEGSSASPHEIVELSKLVSLLEGKAKRLTADDKRFLALHNELGRLSKLVIDLAS